MIDADGNFEIAAVAGTAEDAIEALGQVMVDIVLLDLEMPGAGGLKSIPRILEAAKGAKVLIVSSLAEEGAEETVAALALGAADTLPKPGTGRFNGRFSEVLLGKLRELGYADRSSRPAASARRCRREPAAPCQATSRSSCWRSAPRPAASTRSAAFFAALPKRIGVPILVTQHLPPAFMTVFARQLSVAAGREAVVAEDGMQLLPDRIVIAPGEAHLMVDEVSGKLVARLLQTKVVERLPAVGRSDAGLGRRDARRRRAGRGPDRHGPRRRRRRQAAGRRRRRGDGPGRSELGRVGHAARGRRGGPGLRDPAARQAGPPCRRAASRRRSCK